MAAIEVAALGQLAGFGRKEIDALLADAEAAGLARAPGLRNPDAAPGVLARPIAASGDLWVTWVGIASCVVMLRRPRTIDKYPIGRKATQHERNFYALRVGGDGKRARSRVTPKAAGQLAQRPASLAGRLVDLGRRRRLKSIRHVWISLPAFDRLHQ